MNPTVTFYSWLIEGRASRILGLKWINSNLYSYIGGYKSLMTGLYRNVQKYWPVLSMDYKGKIFIPGRGSNPYINDGSAVLCSCHLKITEKLHSPLLQAKWGFRELLCSWRDLIAFFQRRSDTPRGPQTPSFRSRILMCAHMELSMVSGSWR